MNSLVRLTLVLVIAWMCDSRAFAAPELFFYPPPIRLADGALVYSPVTFAPEQLTSDFPQIDEMSGVVLIAYWSTICPTENACNFELIDRVLDYWKARKKKVVLSIATVGFPIRVYQDGQSRELNATPDWVLRRVTTFSEPSRVITAIGEPPHQSLAVFPVYNDPSFVSEIRKLVAQLARYDGNSTIAQVRISAGLLGEDNPSVDGLKSRMPGFSDTVWTNYCRLMLDIYAEKFHRTQLEFDLGRISWSGALGDEAQKRLEATLITELQNKHALIAFDGLESSTLSVLEGPVDRKTLGPARTLSRLVATKQKGESIGLESAAPLQVPRMNDIASIEATIEKIMPSRLVLFGTDAGIINLARTGENPTNETTRRFISKDRRSEEGARAINLLKQIGIK